MYICRVLWTEPELAHGSFANFDARLNCRHSSRLNHRRRRRSYGRLDHLRQSSQINHRRTQRRNRLLDCRRLHPRPHRRNLRQSMLGEANTRNYFAKKINKEIYQEFRQGLEPQKVGKPPYKKKPKTAEARLKMREGKKEQRLLANNRRASWKKKQEERRAAAAGTPGSAASSPRSGLAESFETQQFCEQ